jgi:hypothetical protein
MIKTFFKNLLYKITSRAFWVFLITTFIVWTVIIIILTTDIAPEKYNTWINTLLWIWGGTIVFYIGGSVLIDALAKMVEKASLTVNTSINAATKTNITGG